MKVLKFKLKKIDLVRNSADEVFIMRGIQISQLKYSFMFNEQLEKLIEMALMDGELTEKEKQILFKKAESMGVDLDEFEMVLEAKLFEKQQEINAAQAPVDTPPPPPVPESKAAPKSDKLGDVKKCPGCGAITQSFTTKCADCGTEFRNVGASQNITKFFDKLNELEASRGEALFVSENLSGNLGCGTIIKWMFLYPILLPYNIIIFLINKSKPPKWSTTDMRKEEMIMNFPVPNSKEEIIEFLTLSISKIQQVSLLTRFNEEGKYISKWNSIWSKKAEQIYTKAKLSMANDKASIQVIEQLLIDAKVIQAKK